MQQSQDPREFERPLAGQGDQPPEPCPYKRRTEDRRVVAVAHVRLTNELADEGEHAKRR